MSEKVNFTKTLPDYRATKVFSIVDVPTRQFLMVDGHGDPNTSEEYTEALAALYPVAYALKFLSKKAGRDYVVPPLEGLWWADDMAVFTTERDKSQWRWTMMLLVPEWLDADQVRIAEEQAHAKKDPPSRLAEVRLQSLDEGTCVQVLHIGPYDDEAAVLAELHEQFLPAHGLRPTGTHHEIYLSDPRRAAPEKLRTILRQPVLNP